MEPSQDLALRQKQEVATKEERTVPGRYYAPVTDIYETDNGLMIVMEMPGVTKERLTIDLQGDVLRMVVREGAELAGLGTLAGLGGALVLTRFLRGLLFEIQPTDPATFVAVAILLTLVALLACYIPARRAMRVDPMVALRYE